MSTRSVDWWRSIDLRSAPGDAPVAFCSDLRPDSLFAAYSRGLFPFPAVDPYARAMNEVRFEHQVRVGVIAVPEEEPTVPYQVPWWSPDPRPVIPLSVEGSEERLSRRLSRSLRNRLKWTTTADRAFPRVVDECAAGRSPCWLTEELRQSLLALHQAGVAHSAEVWEEDELIGGVYGIRVGPVLSLDSMFHRRPNASRVAVADLADRFAAAGGRLLDAQWDSQHIRRLGARPVPRDHYLALLSTAPAGVPDPIRLPARRLAVAAT